ncbi:MAG TPA: DUF2281 domain-containing protein [Deltaproteobacteria bacterium]|nr:DUF2281 domain-containing protein [Deltaproteobacteria bacterium]HHO76300.1 DUF2281 domain-containing protein [Deltaproteobacteria bacterium]
MSLADKILHHIERLPENKQIEILDFIEYIEAKVTDQENTSWSDMSLSSAMRDMEDEESPYSQDDIIETFS